LKKKCGRIKRPQRDSMSQSNFQLKFSKSEKCEVNQPMTVKIERRSIDNTVEEQIVTAMITSTKFLVTIENLFSPSYMQNTFARIISYWCMDYFQQYKKAPGIHIQDIFLTESEEGLSKEDKELVGEFLTKLSARFEKLGHINVEYMKDIAFAYFRKRELQIRTEAAKRYLDAGKVEEAEDQFSKYKKIAYQTSGWFNPFDSREILEVFDSSEEGVFTLPGALGQMFGPFEEGWFIAVLASFKKGKTWFLQEMAVRAIFQQLRVVFISLEMKKKNLKERLLKRITGFGSRTGEDVFLFPVFDCLHNQLGDCDRPERTNTLRLSSRKEDKPAFDLDSDYRVCTYCRERMLENYQPATWFEPLEVPQFALKPTRKMARAMVEMYGDNLRMIAYPRFMASVSDIRRDLYILEQHEGFIPDVIIVDYADILKPDTPGDKREKIDDIWKMLASLAAEKHCIVFTASQGTRGAIHKTDLDQEDLAEWIGKLAHVDIFLGLNQTVPEKQSKLIRVNLLVHRHKEVNENITAVLLQQLELGQFALDSQLVRKEDL